MAKERKQDIKELQGLVHTASVGLSLVIETIIERDMQSELDPNGRAGIGNLREAETTLENLENLLGFKLDGLTGEDLDNAMFDK